MQRATIVLIVLAALLIPATAFSQTVDWDGQVHKGDFSAFVGVGFGTGFTVVPGVEYAIVDFKAGDEVPLAVGVAAKGAINFYSSYWSSFGVGALGTLHLGFKGLDLPEFLQKFDVYISVGLGFSWFNYVGTPPTWWEKEDFKVLFITANGVAYYINDKLAVYAEGNYWVRGGAALGVLFKL